MESFNAETNRRLVEFSEGLAAAIRKAGAAVCAINARPRVPTSGVHWRPGVVVSTNHTVNWDEEITINFPDGALITATLAGRDPSTDLAVLRIDEEAAKTFETAKVGDAGSIETGKFVLALGRVNERGVSAGSGIVSNTGGPWRTWRGGEINSFIRLDLGIFLGFSGGALVDVEGHVLGINTSALVRGSGITIPAATVDRVVDALLKQGHIARGYLGLGMYPVKLADNMREALGLGDDRGLVLLSVEPGGPAATAGLILGDVLVALDAAPVGETDDVQAKLGPERVGQKVTATFIRGGAKMECELIIGERPRNRHGKARAEKRPC